MLEAKTSTVHLELARQLAAATTARDARRVILGWDRLQPIGGGPRRPTRASGAALGIWRPRSIDGETWFVRDPDLVAGRQHLWASAERIPPKRERRRVVLVGESCARAWPLDPLFTCASALATFFAAVAGQDAIEIVDLACCGIEADALVELIDAAQALASDAYVIYAGNNWAAAPEDLDFDAMAAALREAGSWRALQPHFEGALRSRASAALAAIARATRAVPALFVIPAATMQDYDFSTALYNPLLTPCEQTARRDLSAAFDRCVSDADFHDAEENARRLVALEDGVSAAGLHALARCALAHGEADEAVRLFDAAQQALLSVPAYGLTSHAVVAAEIRSQVGTHGLHPVDLRPYLLEQNGGQPLGRELFLDNVHMTAKGVALAMAATAEKLMPLLGISGASREALLAVDVPVDPRAEAQAHSVVGHLSLRAESLAAHHFKRAAECDRRIVEVMRGTADLVLSRPSVPYTFCDAFRRVKAFADVFPVLQGLAPTPHRPFFPGDLTLLRLTGDTAPDARDHYESLIRQRHAIDDREVDLLPYASFSDYAYPTQPSVLGPRCWTPARAYLKCFRRDSVFVVVCHEPPARLHLVLTIRGGGTCADDHEASLLLNGVHVTTWRIGADWRTVDCTIDAPPMRSGVNALTLLWPNPDETRGDRVRHVVRAFERQAAGERPGTFEFIPAIYTVYGEISVLTLAATRDVTSRSFRSAVPGPLTRSAGTRALAAS